MIVPVILCGGAGTRLWPTSRADLPKPLLPLLGGQSTFALTVTRVADRAAFTDPVIVAGASHRHLIEAALAHAKAPARLLLEPTPRDTAMAIAVAAVVVADQDPDAVLLALPADHVIRDVTAFVAAIGSARAAADDDRIVTFGVRPDRPAGEFGYIRPGASMANGISSVDQFVEKPDAVTAAALIADGCLWNAGIFLMRATTAIDLIERYAPAVARAARDAVAGAVDDGALVLAARPFPRSPGDVVRPRRHGEDRSRRRRRGALRLVRPRHLGGGLGSFNKDAAGNSVDGDVVLVDTRGSYVTTARPTVGVVGLDDAIVVVSDDAVLVASRAHADAVKTLVAAIDARPEAVVGDFARHYRPWGHYQSLELGSDYQVKRIVIDPRQRLSLQHHAHRSEHWTVVAGAAEATIGAKVVAMQAGDSVDVPRGAVHRLANHGAVPLVVIELQFGAYLGEDDIVRIEDDYGRSG